MASALAHTQRSHLALVASATERDPDAIRLAATPRLKRFLEAAANAGLQPAEAVALGLDRALALSDGAELCGEVELARQRLSAAAAEARACGPTSTAQAARIRRLIAARPLAPAEVGEELVVRLEERQLGRAGSLSVGSLRADVVTEMVSWELAATLSGRPITEWALWVLARGPRRRP